MSEPAVVADAREVAEATLAGRVNDWPAVAQENARNVLALLDAPEAVLARERLVGLCHAAVNLSERIVRTHSRFASRDETYAFTYDSGGVIEAFRKQLAITTEGAKL